MRRSLAQRLVAICILFPALALTGCGGAATPPPSYPPGAIVVTANVRKFNTSELVVPAGAPFTLVLVNRESDPHNVAIRTKSGFDGEIVFRHDPISAATVVLEVGAIPAGTYSFLCEVHPTMTGTVVAR